MKDNIFRVIMLWLFSIIVFSCSNEEEVEPSLEVSPITIQGTWKLAELNNSALPEEFYVYITFDREGKYTMYQKHDSMYPRCITGSYVIEKDYFLGYIISGEYDFGNGEWNNEYIVTDLLQSGSMVWTVKNGEEVTKYVRCDAVPQEIIDEAKVSDE